MTVDIGVQYEQFLAMNKNIRLVIVVSRVFLLRKKCWGRGEGGWFVHHPFSGWSQFLSRLWLRGWHSWQRLQALGTGGSELTAPCAAAPAVPALCLLCKPCREPWLLLGQPWGCCSSEASGASIPYPEDRGQWDASLLFTEKMDIPCPFACRFLEHFVKLQMLFNVHLHEIDSFILKQ